jgi:hypothetical protein
VLKTYAGEFVQRDGISASTLRSSLESRSITAMPTSANLEHSFCWSEAEQSINFLHVRPVHLNSWRALYRYEGYHSELRSICPRRPSNQPTKAIHAVSHVSGLSHCHYSRRAFNYNRWIASGSYHCVEVISCSSKCGWIGENHLNFPHARPISVSYHSSCCSSLLLVSSLDERIGPRNVRISPKRMSFCCVCRRREVKRIRA